MRLESSNYKSPIRSDSDKKGVRCTLYGPRGCETNIPKISDISSIPKSIAHAVDLNLGAKKTQYGNFVIGSILQLLPMLNMSSKIVIANMIIYN